MSLEQYKVFNLIEDVLALKVLLILESPHINEYIHQHPAAGESALELTQFLIGQGHLNSFDAQLPIGCNIKKLNYKPLGILNCSTLPMNKAFYPCVLAGEDLLQVNQLAAIKQYFAQSSLNKGDEQQTTDSQISGNDFLNNSIFRDFKFRLTQVLEQAASDIIIVPCGDTAIGFMEAFKAGYQKPLMVLDGLPHPTEPEWAEKIANINLTDRIAPKLLP
ncbi:hypothetical protein [Psychrobacter sp. DAB_AL43B]|uniref:hypothetical protein n=1 Tax=Psychrobacter sp. DAB_AL43B TaxID=1028416 RepID=UPI0009A5A7B9|nr:hypothetical protein [Psychrobacter sp. DAB_AL43B]SLJ84431.1 hypothetical protein DABAL43B_1235 [Psychrobacter sp. DAB_AL43B]